MHRRKNFLPTLILTLLSWLSWLYIVFYFSPKNTIKFSIFLFFLLLALSLTLTFSLIFANSRRGFVLSLGIVGFLALRAANLDNYLNLILLFGIILSLELYFSQRQL